jgi:hypothetical protein
MEFDPQSVTEQQLFEFFFCVFSSAGDDDDDQSGTRVRSPDSGVMMTELWNLCGQNFFHGRPAEK